MNDQRTQDPGEQTAFYFDSSACSGCKACQVACKDKHQLPVGILWRRVYQVTGGDWTRQGDAWTSDVFAYNVSLACNHCTHPICVEACPTGAMAKREDGVVLVSAEKCVGCRYCSWACPYDAPQYDWRSGVMTKCTFCAEDLLPGAPPACVSACPMRTLDSGALSDLRNRPNTLDSIHPLPSSILTDPALVVKPHPDALRSSIAAAQVENTEEVSIRQGSSERPLVVFTILAQLAVGAFCGLTLTRWWIANDSLDRFFVVIPLTMAVAMVASFLHLGSPLNAWRAFANLRSSWLSREILFATLFLGASSLSALMLWFHLGTLESQSLISFGTILLGLALVLAMANVYRLRTLPPWNTIATPLSFYTTTFLLGALLAALSALFAGIASPFCMVLAAVLAALQGLTARNWLDGLKNGNEPARRAYEKISTDHATILQWRWGLAWAGVAAMVITIWLSSSVVLLASLVLIFTSETLWRSLFYEAFSREGGLS